MAPKVIKSGNKDKKAAGEDTAPEEVALQEGEISAGERSNFLTQMKKGAKADPVRAQLFSFYQGLSRFDKKKTEIIKAWKMDKSLKWSGKYIQENIKTNITEQSTFSGHGTRLLVLKLCFASHSGFDCALTSVHLHLANLVVFCIFGDTAFSCCFGLFVLCHVQVGCGCSSEHEGRHP